jgi:hypothetical protein
MDTITKTAGNYIRPLLFPSRLSRVRASAVPYSPQSQGRPDNSYGGNGSSGCDRPAYAIMQPFRKVALHCGSLGI